MEAQNEFKTIYTRPAGYQKEFLLRWSHIQFYPVSLQQHRSAINPEPGSTYAGIMDFHE